MKATSGFNLPAKHVLHVVPPRWRDGAGAEAEVAALWKKEAERATSESVRLKEQLKRTALACCYARCFASARELQCATVAFTLSLIHI